MPYRRNYNNPGEQMVGLPYEKGPTTTAPQPTASSPGTWTKKQWREQMVRGKQSGGDWVNKKQWMQARRQARREASNPYQGQGSFGAVYGLASDKKDVHNTSPSAQYGRTIQAVSQMGRPGLDIMEQYTQPAFREAYESAQGLGNLASMRGGRALAMQDLSDRMARSGMAGSGIEAASRAAIDRRWGQQLADAQLQANALRQQAMQSLSGQALQGGMQSGQMIMSPLQQWNQYKVQAKLQDRAEHAGQKAANQAALGQAVGGGLSLAMAPMTGGMSLGNTLGGTLFNAIRNRYNQYRHPYSGMEGILDY